MKKIILLFALVLLNCHKNPYLPEDSVTLKVERIEFVKNDFFSCWHSIPPCYGYYVALKCIDSSFVNIDFLKVFISINSSSPLNEMPYSTNDAEYYFYRYKNLICIKMIPLAVPAVIPKSLIVKLLYTEL
jgi:hypothetical protein